MVSLMIAMTSLTAAVSPGVDEWRSTLPKCTEWEAWYPKSGERPPDFNTWPSHAALPDPLADEAGGEVRKEGWPKQRERLKQLFSQWVLGDSPPAPDNLTVRILSETPGQGATVREVELRFGAEHKAVLWVQLYIPLGPGPFPVFLTQDNHRPWGLIALQRGYLACVYAGSDSRDDTDSFLEAYPGYDWSRLTRRAWAASRCIDYLAQVPQADTAKIAITGHSRNGKLSLIASAYDERISVVISSSSGTGGSLASRYCGEPHFGEGIENITRSFPDWFHPRWRFFVGREQKMPVDLNELVALSAPRPCLLSTAINDTVESTWGIQQTYLSAKPAYAMFGAEDRFRILWRPAGHETWPTVIERYLDWCDLQFGRGVYDFPERMLHPWDWEGWRQRAKNVPDAAAYPERPFDAGIVTPKASGADWQARQAGIREAVTKLLGAAPPSAHAPSGTYGSDRPYIEAMLGRDVPGPQLEKQDLVFGDYINADVYYKKDLKNSGKKLPAVLWLHPFSYPRGYGASYRRGEEVFRTLARAGYATFCFDQAGFGRRVEEVEGFYSRYPDWSMLGKMLQDTQAALDAMEEIEYVDQKQIYVVGYGLGAFVALHLAALDDRPAGYALVCAPPPFRLDTDIAETEGIRRWSKLHMLLPQLGMFIGQESRVPYDVDELLGLMAPRPTLVVSPRWDRESPLPMMERAVASAKPAFKVLGAEKALHQEIPEAYNHFDSSMQQVVLQWLKRTAPPAK